MQLCLDGGREGRLLSHLWEEGSGGMWGCPQLSWPWTRYPSPGALPPPSSGLFPVGPGEDDSAPTEEREARPAQGAQGGQAARQEVGQNRLQYLFYVPCPSPWGEVVTQGPHRKGLNCQEGAVSGSQAQQGCYAEAAVGAGAGLPFPSRDQGQLEAPGLGPEQGSTDRTTGLLFPVRWRP